MARSHAASPQSPREKPLDRYEKSENTKRSHHVRRKSGGPRDDKKRPALTRRTTPQHIKTGRRDRDRERDDDAVRDRDGGESFPQFCMTCEKQFLPANSTILYCSETCRLHDQAPASTRPQSYSTLPSLSPPTSPYYQHQRIPSDGPDIIPRFSPTQPRPRSYFNSDPYPSSSSSYHPSSSSHFETSRSATSSRSSTALASLRDLAAALPRCPNPESSPPRSPSSAVWSYIPFTRTGTATPTPTTTPGNSYGSPKAHAQLHAYAAEYTDDPFAGGRRSSAYMVTYGGMGAGMDRPLPPRSGPGGYGNRGRHIDLVTPFAV